MIVAMYLRLSSADEETGFTKKESESIINQRLYITDFLKQHQTLSSYERIEFVDDGYSGAYSDRPKLTEMLEQARSGLIDVICVKDFSRFFRNYIEAGNYLECVFPFLGIRFISINDNYDSDDYKGSTGGLEMVMRNIIYASYSKDLSIKTTVARELKMKQGKFVGSHAPFGYIMHPTVKNKLAIDDQSARIVRRIFDSAISGKNTSQIAKLLNENKTPTPAQYFKEKYPNNKKFSFMSHEISWTAAMVYLIIKNERYTGTLVSGRKKKVANDVNKYIRSTPIVVENTHEAIVTKTEFETAQKVIKKVKDRGQRVSKEFPLKSFVRCANCGRLMKRKLGAKGEYYFECIYSNHDSHTGCPVNQRFKEKEIEEKVLTVIRTYLSMAEKNIPKKRNEINPLDVQVQIAKTKNKISKYKQRKLVIYENYVSDGISKEQYLKKKIELDTCMSELEEHILELNNIDIEHSTYIEEKNRYQQFDMSTLTNKLAKSFINSVLLGSGNTIEVNLKFKDIHL